MQGFYSQTYENGSFFKEANLPLHFSASIHWNLKTSRLFLLGKIYEFLGSDVLYDSNKIEQSIDRLYQAHEEDFVTKINGNFLFWYSPENSESVFLVNNRHEAGNLYFFQDNRGFFFSTKLKNLLTLSQDHPNPEFGSVRSFLANGFTISEKTQLAGIEKTLPADYFIFRKNSEIPIRKTYWKKIFSFHRKPFQNLEKKIDEYEQVYQTGIKNFLRANPQNQFGCLLSGGHDTSYLLAQTRNVFSGPIHTYTVVFPDWKFDEGPAAESVAKKFDTIHHPIPFRPEDLDEIIPMIFHIEEPVLGSSLSLHCLAKEAKKEVSVIFGGDGGDTMWGEYYPVEEYHRWVKHLPTPIRKTIHQASLALRDCFDWERFWEFEHVAGLFAESRYHSDFLRKLCTYRHFNLDFQKEILQSEIFNTPYTKAHNEIPFRDSTFGDALIEGKLLNGFYTYQGHHTIKLCEANEIEFFMPTIQPKMLEFINSLPKEWVNGGNTFQRLTNNKRINRYFHKLALKRYFSSNEIYNRSFDMPWFKVLKPRVELQSILLHALKTRGWYNEKPLEHLFEGFSNQRVKDHEILELKNHGYRLITLLGMEVWSRLFLDRIPYREGLTLEELLSAPRS